MSATREEPNQFFERAIEALFKNSTDAIVMFDENHCVVEINERFSDLFGYELAQIKGKNVDDVMNMGKNGTTNKQYTEAVMAGEKVEEESIRYNRDGNPLEVIIKGIPILIDGKLRGGYGIYSDIRELKRTEEELRRSDLRNRALVSAIPDMLFRYNHEGFYLDAEIKYSRFMSEQSKKLFESGGLIGKNLADVLPAKTAKLILKAVQKTSATGELQVVEYSYLIDEVEMFFEARLVDAGGGEVVSIVRDITERKHFEEQLTFLSLHDHLTGLYNRAYFKNELDRLSNGREYPVSIISIDLDGMKLVNDTLGHATGDELLKACAKVLGQSLRQSDILARVGGDEFFVILPRTTIDVGLEVVQRMHINIDLYNRNNRDFPLSISVGIATAESNDKTLEQVYSEADERMYREKLQKGTAVRAYLIDGLISSLGQKDYLDQGHGRRINELCHKMGEKLGLRAKQLKKLKLIAKVHDLGKVGIPEKILFKDESLNNDDWKLIRQHSEKGYRIALSSDELTGVAELILKHHEHWDGNGYPLGIKGEEIPLECRILAIADAFDAMTNERNYRQTKSMEEAVAELKRFSGSQFDPVLVPQFIAIIEEQAKA